MKTVLLYTRVIKRNGETLTPVDGYHWAFDRFLKTYLEFRPSQDHELVIMDCGGLGPDVEAYHDPQILFRKMEYYGTGWDCGAFQFAANAIDCDLLVCLNAMTYFHTKDWLYPLVAARAHYGPGLYGVSASYELGPHIRTPCMAVSPELLRGYPTVVKDRKSCCAFEAGPDCFTKFALAQKVPVFLMARDEAIPEKEWRHPRLKNIFRRGDQSEVLVWDRHVDLFSLATQEAKEVLSAYADRL